MEYSALEGISGYSAGPCLLFVIGVGRKSLRKQYESVNPDRLITFPADDPQLVKQLKAVRKFIWRNQAIIGMPTDGIRQNGGVDYCLFLLLLTGVIQRQWGLYLLWYLAMMFCAMC